MHDLDATTEPPSRLPSLTVMAAAAALAIVTAIGVVLVFNFVDDQAERDLRAWQVRMGIVADSRFAVVDEWLSQQFGHVRGLSENASLQLYLTELSMFEGDSTQVTDEPAQRSYLRNLLVATAERAGFKAPMVGADINANVERIGVAGIAIVDNDGMVLVATPGFPPVDEALSDIILSNRGKAMLYDLRIGPGGQPAMGFMTPIFAIQSDGAPSDQIGMALGIKEVAGELYPLLEQPGATEETAETVILRDAGNTVEYLSPLADGSGPLERSLARDTTDLAAIYAIDKPGGFATRHDYKDDEVLVIGRGFTAAPWTLMYKINTTEALAETNTRLVRMLIIFLLIIAAIAGSLIAAWRHGTSLRARQAADTASELARKFAQQRDFLELVTDSQASAMSIIDGDGRYIWVNRQAAENSGTAPDEVAGKLLAAVLGPAPAKPLLETVRNVLHNDARELQTHSDDIDGETRTFVSEFIPLYATETLPARVLLVSEDVTIAVAERAKRERIMRQLVETLVGVVDRRDPNSADHSSWVATVSRAIADEMELDNVLAESVEITGRVMNLGKITVPQEILTKTEALTDDEFALVRGAIGISAELLEGVEFDGPVVETLRQLHQNPGDRALTSKDDVLLTTRIVAVANTFVAMTSPRAYRDGLSFNEAIDMLLTKMETDDTRRVVMSLANYLDNHNGRDRLEGIGKRPPTG
jgi:HD-GYP domain-containing protein (c-di-GMP phosphodiesterase class II)